MAKAVGCACRVSTRSAMWQLRSGLPRLKTGGSPNLSAFTPAFSVLGAQFLGGESYIHLTIGPALFTASLDAE